MQAERTNEGGGGGKKSAFLVVSHQEINVGGVGMSMGSGMADYFAHNASDAVKIADEIFVH